MWVVVVVVFPIASPSAVVLDAHAAAVATIEQAARTRKTNIRAQDTIDPVRGSVVLTAIAIGAACGRAPPIGPVAIGTGTADAAVPAPPSVADAGADAVADAAISRTAATPDYVPPPTSCSRGALAAGTVVIEERSRNRSAEEGGGDEKIVLRKEMRDGANGDRNVRLTLVSSENVQEYASVTKVLRSYMELTPCTREGEPMCPGGPNGLAVMDGWDGQAFETALMAVESSRLFQPVMFEQAKFFREAAAPGLKPGTKMPSFKQVVFVLTDYGELSPGTVTTTFVEEKNEPWGAMRVFRTRISLKEHIAAMAQSAIVQTDGTITTLVRAADGAPIEIDMQTTVRSTPTRFKGPTEVTKSRFKISRPCFRTAFKG